MAKLTDEQQAIVQHSMGQHARVLAVAGSGKTTTMVARIKYLVEEQGIDQQMIDVYMFNADAADHFREKLSQEIPGQTWKGNVHTFHAVALSIIHQGIKHKTIVPYREEWLGEPGTSIQKRHLRSIIKSMVHDGDAVEGELTAEEALRMIGLWKSSMIVPEDAVCESMPQYVKVYEEFEHKRREVPALTFDDFVPVAVNILNNDPELLAGEVSRRAFMIIDEYQDINEGQQRLMKLLAGDRSDVMVVGDDDQTIYEWRGAQPEYILSGFDRDFVNKPVMVYPLSRSFRFGPLLAQSAYNVITENRVRATKELVAHNSEADTEISVIDSDSSTDSQLARRMSSLLGVGQVSAREVMTLGRTYAQMEPLEAECLKARVPFLVPKRGAFFARAENLVLVDYMRLALSLDMKVGDVVPSYQRSGRIDRPRGDYRGEAAEMVLSTINAPRRYVARDDAEQAMLEGSNRGWTVRVTLERLGGPTSPIERMQARFQVGEYVKLLASIVEHMEQHPGISAGTLMSWILDTSGYAKNPPGAPTGDEDNPDDLEASIGNFIEYAKQLELGPAEFIGYLGNLDTTCGKPDEQCVVFTSIHRAKGLEADYIFLPGCNDGNMPVRLKKAESRDDLLRDFEVDTAEAPDDHMESERRLFYVAVTRAKRQLYIGTGGAAGSSRSPFLAEMQLEQTRTIVRAFWDAIRSKARAVNDTACRSFAQICAGLVANAKVARYARDHYASQLETPWIQEHADEAIASAFVDCGPSGTGSTAVEVTSPSRPSDMAGVLSGPWRAAMRRSTGKGMVVDASAAGSRGDEHGPVGAPFADVSTSACSEVYHATRVGNLPNILVSGLRCWDEANPMSWCMPFPEGVVYRRHDRIPLTGKRVTAYVPLSLCARSSFLHELTRDGHGVRNEDVAILCFGASGVLSLPGTIYSDSDIDGRSVEFYQATEFPEHVNWSAVNTRGWSDEITREAKTADVWVPRSVASGLITAVIVHSDAVAERIHNILCDRGSAGRDRSESYARCLGILRVSPESFFSR